MANIIDTLHPKDRTEDNIYPNIVRENIPDGAIDVNKLTNELKERVNKKLYRHGIWLSVTDLQLNCLIDIITDNPTLISSKQKLHEIIGSNKNYPIDGGKVYTSTPILLYFPNTTDDVVYITYVTIQGDTAQAQIPVSTSITIRDYVRELL